MPVLLPHARRVGGASARDSAGEGHVRPKCVSCDGGRSPTAGTPAAHKQEHLERTRSLRGSQGRRSALPAPDLLPRPHGPLTPASCPGALLLGRRIAGHSGHSSGIRPPLPALPPAARPPGAWPRVPFSPRVGTRPCVPPTPRRDLWLRPLPSCSLRPWSSGCPGCGSRKGSQHLGQRRPRPPAWAALCPAPLCGSPGAGHARTLLRGARSHPRTPPAQRLTRAGRRPP